MFYKVLGPLLRTARKSAGLSQEEVAQRMGITNQNVSSWELGKSKIDMNQLLLLCSMYDIDFTDILLKASGKAEVIADNKYTQGERELIELYRRADKADRLAVNLILQKYADPELEMAWREKGRDFDFFDMNRSRAPWPYTK